MRWVWIAWGAAAMTMTSMTDPADAATSATLRIAIVDAETGEPLHARCVVNAALKRAGAEPDGAKPFPVGGEFAYIARGELEFKVPAGTTTVRVERGLEYEPVAEAFEVAEGETVNRTYALRRWTHMAERGWWSGETHIHLPNNQTVEEWMEAQVLGEDLNVGTCLTSWVSKEDEAGVAPVVEDYVRQLTDRHFYSVNDQEIERFPINQYCGPVYLVNLKQHIHLDSPNASYPLSVEYMKRARSLGALAVLHSSVFYDAPVNVALGQVDAIEILCNFFGYGYTMTRVKQYGNEDDVALYGDTAEGTVNMVLGKYYRLLNCGFRLPASGGSAAPVKHNPVGGNRAYVKLDGPLSYEKWMEGLKAGRSVSTNGPMLFLTVDGKDLGDTIEAAGGRRVRASVEGLYNQPLSRLEILMNGQVVATLEPEGDGRRIAGEIEIPLKTSGWIAARVWGAQEMPVRLAHTSPIYVEIPGRPHDASEDAAYFAKWIRHRIAFNESDENIPDETSRAEIQATLREALAVFERMIHGAV